MKARKLRAPVSELATARNLAANIKRKSSPRGFAKLLALREVANLLHLIVSQARRGDHDCGYFLSEFIPTLQKQQARLEKSNESFKETYPRFRSARLATAKDSPLRPLIHRIILKAENERTLAQLSRHIADLRGKQTDMLLALPDLDSSKAAIDQWTDLIVYPRLRKIRRELSSDPRIGQLKKATDENGKFQISLLKPLIRKTVERIAAVPRHYYSSVA